MGDAMTEFGKLVKEAFVMLFKLEFGHDSRHGPNCPECGGLQHEGVDYEAGPDRGHEEGCRLRAILDEFDAWEAR